MLQSKLNKKLRRTQWTYSLSSKAFPRPLRVFLIATWAVGCTINNCYKKNTFKLQLLVKHTTTAGAGVVQEHLTSPGSPSLASCKAVLAACASATLIRKHQAV